MLWLVGVGFLNLNKLKNGAIKCIFYNFSICHETTHYFCPNLCSLTLFG